MASFLETDSERIAFVLGVVAGCFAIIIITTIITGKIKKKYNCNINGASVAMFFALASLALAIALFVKKDLKGLVLLAIFLIITGIVFYLDIRVFGLELGIKMFILEIVLSPGSLFDLSELKTRFLKIYLRILKKQTGNMSAQQQYNYYINNSLNRYYEQPDNQETPQNNDQNNMEQ